MTNIIPYSVGTSVTASQRANRTRRSWWLCVGAAAGLLANLGCSAEALDSDAEDVASAQQPITGPNTKQYRRKGLVKLDFRKPGSSRNRGSDSWGGGCSGSLIARNMVLTAAHCLPGLLFEEFGAIHGTNNVRHGRIRGRIRYNPEGEGVRCMNATCKESDGDMEIDTPFMAFWPSEFTMPDACRRRDLPCFQNDVALITSIDGSDFITYGNNGGSGRADPLDTDRALQGGVTPGDFLRIENSSGIPDRNLNMYGFGATSDNGSSVTVARTASTLLNDIRDLTLMVHAPTSAVPDWICKGDSGGPLIIEHSTRDQSGPSPTPVEAYITGVASHAMNEQQGQCPENNSPIYWYRPGAYVTTMIDPVQNHWGRGGCRRFTAASSSRLLGDRDYFKCF